jgi:hypothetical protein
VSDNSKWVLGRYLEAREGGKQEAVGYAYGGLALRMVEAPRSLQGRPLPVWALTHIGSGHLVGKINGAAGDAFAIGESIADAADWNFRGFEGIADGGEALLGKVVAIRDLVGADVLDLTGDTSDCDLDQARAIGGAFADAATVN